MKMVAFSPQSQKIGEALLLKEEPELLPNCQLWSIIDLGQWADMGESCKEQD